MLEEWIVGVRLGEGDLICVGEVEIVEGEDDSGEIMGCVLKRRLYD